jgi:hypothetical protein
MKSLLLLWQNVAEDLATRCCTCTTLDLRTVRRRSEMEGISFLTITLPTFGKDLERGLELGVVDPRLFQGFKWKRGLPVFLGGFLERIFDRSTGVLLDDPCVESIQAVRQLTLMFGKILLPASDSRYRKAMRGYVECEEEVKAADLARGESLYKDFHRVSRLLFGSLLSKVDSDVYYGRLVPRHGPGATADKLVGNQKYRQVTWPARLEKAGFYSSDYLLPNARHYELLDDVRLLDPGAEIPVKVIAVPKTLKTPRIIGVEPTAMQYAQQAVLASFLEHLKDSFLPDKFLGIDDQTPNQEMAQLGSSNGSLATLDLSEASDRVSYQLVRTLLSDHPHLLDAVDASRSKTADVPGEGLQTLAKFASMGSAMCFPVEAMVFLTVVFLGIERSLNTQLDRRTLKGFVGSVRVYGDDIICPAEHVHSVTDALARYGAKVNVSKSFWDGKFRESCGREYYNGEDVSIVRCRQMFPKSRQDVAEVVSLVSLRNQLYFAGYWGTCGKLLDERIRAVLKHFPVVLPTSPVLGRHSFLGYEAQRIGDKLHDPQVRGYVVRAPLPNNPVQEEYALLKCLLRSARDEDPDLEYNQAVGLVLGPWTGGLPAVDADHLERSGRPQRLGIRLRWYSAV